MPVHPGVSQVLAGQLMLLGVLCSIMGAGLFPEPILLIAGGSLFVVGALLLGRGLLARARTRKTDA